MSSPTHGPDPNISPEGPAQGQPSWGAPSGPAQGYGSPAPSYSGSPAGYEAGTARPQQVLVAAILGFVVAVFALIAALGSFALAGLFGLFVLFGVLYLALAALNVWGGVQALRGRGSTALKIAGLITAGLAALGLILSLTQGRFDIWSLVLVAAGAAIYLLLNQPASLQWFASRGSR